MDKFHVIAGVPRAGSTLLANILMQRPGVFVSNTSALAATCGAIKRIWFESPEVRKDMIRDTPSTDDRCVRVMRSVLESWHADRDELVVIDKSRIWNVNTLLLGSVMPEARVLVCVRDLRAVWASIELHAQKRPWAEGSLLPTGSTEFARANHAFKETEPLGRDIYGVEDLIRRKLPRVIFVRFEGLADNPRGTMEVVDDALGMERFEYNFENVQNRTDEVDAFELHAFPHEGSGKVAPPPEIWRTSVPTDIAANIMRLFPLYNQTFGYF